jgi:hypothetical protein
MSSLVNMGKVSCNQATRLSSDVMFCGTNDVPSFALLPTSAFSPLTLLRRSC